MGFIWKDHFFFAKIAIFCKSIAGPFPSVVQAFAEPYSASGRIKLVNLLNKLIVTVQEVSTSWKKTLNGGPNERNLFKPNSEPVISMLNAGQRHLET